MRSKEDQIDLPGLSVPIQQLVLFISAQVTQLISDHPRNHLKLTVLREDQKAIRIKLVTKDDQADEKSTDHREVEQHPEDDLQVEG